MKWGARGLLHPESLDQLDSERWIPALEHRYVTPMRELEDPSMHASSTHFPGLNFGRLLTGEGKRQWVWS